MTNKVLITGGAGFIGSYLVDCLLRKEYAVVCIDNLDTQIHGPDRKPPDYLDPRADLVVADIRDASAVRHALQDADTVFHFAARVGVGQSMYEAADYIDVNDRGTAVLLEAMIERQRQRPFRRLVVASSMSIYGEGLYRDAEGEVVDRVERSAPQLRDRRWDPLDEVGRPLRPVATPETKPPALMSVYALSKYDQERLCLLVGGAYGIPTVALRFFNVYGPRQALSNPYSGVLAIFAARLLNGKPPVVFEDGRQQRDFVHATDVAQACCLAMENDAAIGQAFNVGSGQTFTINKVADCLAATLGLDIAPEITGECRIGDVRHCFPDMTKSRDVLGFRPRIGIEDGIGKFAGWLAGRIAVDRIEEAREALAMRRLTI